jgi:hypothetical protein
METTTVRAYRQSSVASPSSVIRLSAAEGSWRDRWPISGVNSWKSDKVGRIARRNGHDISRISNHVGLSREDSVSVQALVSSRGQTSSSNVGPEFSSSPNDGRGDRVGLITPIKSGRSSLPTTFFVKVPHEFGVNVIGCVVLGVDRRELFRQLFLPSVPFFCGNRPNSSCDGINIRFALKGLAVRTCCRRRERRSDGIGRLCLKLRRSRS